MNGAPPGFKPTRRSWSTDELNLLRTLIPTGMTLASIALRFGRSYTCVRYRARLEGIPIPAMRRKNPLTAPADTQAPTTLSPAPPPRDSTSPLP